MLAPGADGIGLVQPDRVLDRLPEARRAAGLLSRNRAPAGSYDLWLLELPFIICRRFCQFDSYYTTIEIPFCFFGNSLSKG